MNYNTLAIMLTNKCDINCGMCCEGCIDNEDLSEEILLQFLSSLSEEGPIKNIAITGGEAFLRFSLMEKVIKYSKSLGKNVSVITNANWCESYCYTYNKLEKIKKLGLDTIGVSYDEFHKKYVSEDKIKNIIRASKDLALNINMQICITKDTDIGLILNNFKDDLDKVLVNFIPCMYVGKAKINISKEKFLLKEYNGDIVCQKAGSLLIDNSGEIYPCCSPMAYNLGIKLGNIENYSSINEVLKRINENIYFLMLRNYGFKYYIDKARYLDITLPDKIVSPCDICSILFKNSNLFKLLPLIREDLNDNKLGRNIYKEI